MKKEFTPALTRRLFLKSSTALFTGAVVGGYTLHNADAVTLKEFNLLASANPVRLVPKPGGGNRCLDLQWKGPWSRDPGPTRRAYPYHRRQ